MAKHPASEFLQTALIKQQVAAASASVGRDAAEAFGQEMEDRIELNAAEFPRTDLSFDSPLELAFWVWWMAFKKMDFFSQHDLDLVPHLDIEASGNHYVLDFSLEPSPERRRRGEAVKAWPRIGVELDGHAFHEKTLDQVTYRNQRDRDLQRAGWRIFHYSFSEFTAHPEDCVLEVIEHARYHYIPLPCKSTPDK